MYMLFIVVFLRCYSFLLLSYFFHLVSTSYIFFVCFFFNVTATTEIYTYCHTLSLHDALPIYSWYWHMYDTVKGSDWVGDQEASGFICREAPKAGYELEHFGMPCDRNPDGTIYQRPFGGHTANFGEKPVQRACAAADRTGHAMLHTLYQRNVAARTQCFVEWMALDLLRNEAGDVQGVTALEMETGEIYSQEAKQTVLATGGAGPLWAASTHPFLTPGDGTGMD